MNKKTKNLSTRQLFAFGGASLSAAALIFCFYNSQIRQRVEAVITDNNLSLAPLEEYVRKIEPFYSGSKAIKDLQRLNGEEIKKSEVTRIAERSKRLFGLVVHLTKVRSTQDELELFEKTLTRHGLIYTDNQLIGRGTKGTVWKTIPGSVLMSFQLILPKRWRQATSLLSCVTLCFALNSLGIPKEELRIKFPNDVLWKGQKISGCLGQVDDCPENFEQILVKLGVGCNIYLPSKRGSKEFTALPSKFSREKLMGEYFDVLYFLIQDFEVFKKEALKWVSIEDIQKAGLDTLM